MGILERFVGRVRDRDGRAQALEALAAEGPHGPQPLSDSDRVLRGVIGTKLLEGWLANRRQTRLPHTLNLHVLGPDHAGLLVAVMAATARAAGPSDPDESRHLAHALRLAGAGEAEARRLEEALSEPQPLPELLDQVQEEGLAPHAYAAALLATGRRGRVQRAFLDYLGARLGLAPEAMASLERRTRA